jgi:magnesium transporter
MRTLTAPVDLDELADLCRRDEFFWLDLSEPELEQFDGMADVLHLHPLAVEDTREFGQRPKVDAYAQQLLLVYFGATADEQEFPEAVEVHLHISGSFVVTVHRRPCGRFEEMRRTLERRPAENQHQLIYRVIDALTDSILDVLEHVAARVEAHEAEVYNRPRSRDRDQMAMLRQSLAGLRRVMVIQRQVFERAVEEVTSLPGLDEGEYQPYYRDVGDHLWRAIDEIEAARDSLAGTLATYTNEVQERLTIVATIFLPLTVITGFFGMNFNWLINHIGSAAVFWGLGVGGMVASAGAIGVWLVRSGLYHRPARRRDPGPP